MKETRNIYIMEHQRYIRGDIKGTSGGTSILILFINSFLLKLNINSLKRHQIKFDDAPLFLFYLMKNGNNTNLALCPLNAHQISTVNYDSLYMNFK